MNLENLCTRYNLSNFFQIIQWNNIVKSYWIHRVLFRRLRFYSCCFFSFILIFKKGWNKERLSFIFMFRIFLVLDMWRMNLDDGGGGVLVQAAGVWAHSVFSRWRAVLPRQRHYLHNTPVVERRSGGQWERLQQSRKSTSSSWAPDRSLPACGPSNMTASMGVRCIWGRVCGDHGNHEEGKAMAAGVDLTIQERRAGPGKAVNITIRQVFTFTTWRHLWMMFDRHDAEHEPVELDSVHARHTHVKKHAEQHREGDQLQESEPSAQTNLEELRRWRLRPAGPGPDHAGALAGHTRGYHHQCREVAHRPHRGRAVRSKDHQTNHT